MKGPGKAPAHNKLKKETGANSETEKPDKQEKLRETSEDQLGVAGPASAENIKRKPRLEVIIIIISSSSQM